MAGWGGRGEYSWGKKVGNSRDTLQSCWSLALMTGLRGYCTVLLYQNHIHLHIYRILLHMQILGGRRSAASVEQVQGTSPPSKSIPRTKVQVLAGFVRREADISTLRVNSEAPVPSNCESTWKVWKEDHVEGGAADCADWENLSGSPAFRRFLCPLNYSHYCTYPLIQ